MASLSPAFRRPRKRPPSQAHQGVAQPRRIRLPLRAGVPARIVYGAACTGILVGLTVLAGWTFEISALKSVLPGFIAMQPWTATSFVLAGLALALAGSEAKSTMWASAAAAAALAVATGLPLIEYLTGHNIGSDTWIFPRTVISGQTHGYPNPGRMSSAAAAALTALAAALLMAPRVSGRLGKAIFSLLATASLFPGVAALLCYALRLEPLDVVLFRNPLALHSAFTLVVLAAGTLALRADAGWVRIAAEQGRAGWTTALLVGVTALLLAFGSDAAVREGTIAANASEAARRIEILLRTLKGAETGQRGFLLTQREDYLQPYEVARARLADDLAATSRALWAAAGPAADAGRLQGLIRDKMTELAEIIALRRSDRLTKALVLVETDRDQAAMDAIQGEADALASIVAVDAEERGGRARRVAQFSAVSVMLVAVLAFLALAAAARGRSDAAAAISASAARWRLFVHEAPAAIAMFDTAMCYLAVSRRFALDHQLAPDATASMIGHCHYDLFPEISEHWRAIHRRVLAGETLSSDEEAFPRADGHVEWLRWEMVPWLQVDGKVGGALLFSEYTTERKAAESALRASEARLRLVQQVGGIAYSDRRVADSTMLISPELQRICGLPPEQTQISVVALLAMLHPDDRDRLCSQRTLLLASGAISVEFRLRRADDGLERWIALRSEVFPGPDGEPSRIVSAWQDITDIVAARQELASRQQDLEQRVSERTAALTKAEARFRGIFDSQFQAISLLAPDGTTLELNRTALEATELPREQVVGHPFWESGYWPAEEHLDLREDIADSADGRLIRREIEITDAHGRRHWIDFSLKPVRDPATDTVMWIIAECRDQTEKRDLANQLAQAQKLQALGQLAGGIAHDFNNILQAVSGAAKLIEQRPGDQDRCRRLAGTLMSASSRGTSIVQRLLSFARRGDLRSEVISTADLLNGIREVLAHTLGTTITVATEVPPDIPCLIADQPQLETAIINLGTNARDAMSDGGTLVLSAAAEFVGPDQPHPADLSPGNYVRLSVADDGTGMDASTLTRVSEPFFTTKPRGKGTGLGLAMVKGFAEQSGGGLSIVSAPGAGTKVTMWLRQAVGNEARVGTEEAEPPVKGQVSARVLLVDDDELVRETLAESLQAAGLATLVASSGVEALALLQAGEAVDAMVSDLSMPGMNGVATIQKARALRPRLPCFLLTGYVGERAALAAEDTFTLVRKPVTGRALVAQIEASLEGAQR